MRFYELVAERKNRRKKSKKTYGGYFYPGFAYGAYGSGSESGADGGGGDGGGGGEGMYEDRDSTEEVNKFKDWACRRLNIRTSPSIELSMDTEEAQQGHHTGRHVPGSNNIWVYAANRNLVDMLRTVFHELVHVRQGELGMIGNNDSYPGSAIEAMADMLAGKYIKIYGKENPHIFQ